MRRTDTPERRRRLRRRYDPRAMHLVSGKCDQPTWTIGVDGRTQDTSPCGLCLPCRVQARLGPHLSAEIEHDLALHGDRRLFKERRRQATTVRTERRRSAARGQAH